MSFQFTFGNTSWLCSVEELRAYCPSPQPLSVESSDDGETAQKGNDGRPPVRLGQVVN